MSVLRHMSELSRALRQRAVDWFLRDLHLRGVQFGEHSITMSPAGVGDVLRWSATKAPVAAGDIGMNVTTGRPEAFIGGAAKGLADTGQVLAVTAQRVISSGSTAIAAGSNVLLGTLTRNASERIFAADFVQDDVAGITFASDRAGLIAAGLAIGIGHFHQRTANANEFETRATNSSAVNGRTLDWLIIGIVP